MECRASLVHGHLVLPGLDPDELRYGQLLTLLSALLVLLVLHLPLMLGKQRSSHSAPDDGNRRASDLSIS